MRAGQKAVTVYFVIKLYNAIRAIMRKFNLPYSFSDFVRIACQEKIDRLEKGLG